LLSFFGQPSLRIRLANYGQNVHFLSRHIIEHSNIADPESILRFRKSTKPLDTTLARPLRLVPQMLLNCGFHNRLVMSPQFPKIADGLLS